MPIAPLKPRTYHVTIEGRNWRLTMRVAQCWSPAQAISMGISKLIGKGFRLPAKYAASARKIRSRADC